MKGHQSEVMNSDQSLETNLNILMDTQARRAHTDTTLTDNALQFSLEHNGKRVQGAIIKTLRRGISENMLITSYKEKFKTFYNSIQWDAFKYATKHMQQYRSIFKLIHNIVPNMETLQTERCQ